MHRKRLWLETVVVFTCVFAAIALAAPSTTQSTASEKPTDSSPQSGARAQRFHERHQRYLERGKAGPIDLLFIGDSITEGWEWGKSPVIWEKHFAAKNAANFGISSDRTQNVIWRITEGGELEGLAPKLIVLMIGTNNIGRDEPDAIAAGIEKIVAIIQEKSPKTKVLLLGIFPRDAGGAEAAKTVSQVNHRIAKLDDEGQRIRYLDLAPKFVDESGHLPKSISPDGLHLNEAGYQIWADAIAPVIDEMMK